MLDYKQMKLILDEVVSAILTARDFCWDEREAVREVLAGHKIEDRSTRSQVWSMAEKIADEQWAEYQFQAGVVSTWR